MQDERMVEGYLFLNDEDAELARQEKKKIDYLEKHLDYTNTENVLRVYKKAILERIFKTPVGQTYLRRLQIYLLRCGEIDAEDVPPIALYDSYGMKMRKSYAPAAKRVKPSEKKHVQWQMVSVILNIVLALGVAAMFVITLKSDNPNILNYESQLVNKYAAWEQEISERERIVREKERELHIGGN